MDYSAFEGYMQMRSTPSTKKRFAWLRLHDEQKMTYDKIAQANGISISRVQQVVARYRKLAERHAVQIEGYSRVVSRYLGRDIDKHKVETLCFRVTPAWPKRECIETAYQGCPMKIYVDSAWKLVKVDDLPDEHGYDLLDEFLRDILNGSNK